MISFIFTNLSKLQYSVNIKLHIICYLFGEEEQSDGVYFVSSVLMTVCELVFKLLLNKR